MIALSRGGSLVTVSCRLKNLHRLTKVIYQVLSAVRAFSFVFIAPPTSMPLLCRRLSCTFAFDAQCVSTRAQLNLLLCLCYGMIRLQIQNCRGSSHRRLNSTQTFHN